MSRAFWSNEVDTSIEVYEHIDLYLLRANYWYLPPIT